MAINCRCDDFVRSLTLGGVVNFTHKKTRCTPNVKYGIIGALDLHNVNIPNMKVSSLPSPYIDRYTALLFLYIQVL